MPHGRDRPLTRRNTLLAVIGLLAVGLANLAFLRQDLPVAVGSAIGRDADADRWAAWVAHYERLFAMLHEGSVVGIQVAGERSVGIAVYRGPGGGIASRRVLRLAAEDPGVILTIERATAQALLARTTGDPDEIWQILKDRLSEGRIRIWSDPDLERLYSGGYLAFMRSIDARPPDLDWLTIRRKLGELPP